LVGEVKKKERDFLILGERRIEKRKLKSKPPARGILRIVMAFGLI